MSSLGKTFGGIGQALYRLRKQLEADVTAAHGQISMGHADLISLACSWERVAELACARIAKNKSTDEVEDAKAAATATMRRSAAIRQLGLGDNKPRSEWDVVDEMREAEEMAEEDDTTQEGGE